MNKEPEFAIGKTEEAHGVAPGQRTSVEAVTLVLGGRITAHTAMPVWRSALETLNSHPDRPIVIDASRVEHVDTVGIALLFDLKHRARPAGAGVAFQALASNLMALLHRFDTAPFTLPVVARRGVGTFEHVGRSTVTQLRYAGELFEFLTRCAQSLIGAARRSGAVIWKDVLDVATEAGAHAVPIILLTGFLMGVIIAFEVGLVARQFGAVIFVVNGVGKAMLRELGPLMTAIVLAGRTGAAFAAQIGTQKVNEELNAISTFGLDPIEFLVLPRLLAAMLVVPLLTVLADVVGLFGGALVMANTFDVGYRQFYSQLLKAVTAGDLTLGIVKAGVFGLAIAVIGCHRGLRTGAGPAAVGLSATSAVVTSIVMIVVIDGLFAVITS
jgi:phospholipid/cholesterol/gamma-HCH transport system permease protein